MVWPLVVGLMVGLNGIQHCMEEIVKTCSSLEAA